MNTSNNPISTTNADDTEIHKAVRDAYGKRVKGEGGCCSKKKSCCMAPSADIQRAAEKMGYTKEEMKSVPDESNLGLGCGAPLKLADVSKGETVLDLGSGAGFDSFLAANLVGETGRVIGVDMTKEMIEKARSNAKKHKGSGVSVEFRHGKIEALPVEDSSVDVIISNCVINLSPNKQAVFGEAFRVLKPGGRIAVSDIVLTKALPEPVQKNLAAYVGCIAGASLLDDYIGNMKKAGFRDVHASTVRAFDVLEADDPVVKAALVGIDKEGASLDDMKDTIVSAKILAYKP